MRVSSGVEKKGEEKKEGMIFHDRVGDNNGSCEYSKNEED